MIELAAFAKQRLTAEVGVLAITMTMLSEHPSTASSMRTRHEES